MRYELDAYGYIKTVAFGCMTSTCNEYTGVVPIGYSSLLEWSTYAYIQAYYIDENGNLMLDLDRLTECKRKEAQDAIDNAPLLRKDLYETEEILENQYKKKTASGKVVVLEDIKTYPPRLKITGIQPLEYTGLSIYTQGRNMMPNDAVNVTISGVTFTKNDSGKLTLDGVASADIEYTVSGGGSVPLFALKAGYDYYLNLGGLDCELRYFDGETTAQQYIGPSGLLNLEQSIEVTEVVIRIAQGRTVNLSFYPQLEYGTEFTSYEPHKRRAIEIDFADHINAIRPSDTLFPSDLLFPTEVPSIDHIRIENGSVYISVDGVETAMGSGNVGLYADYDTIYTTKDADIEIEYRSTVFDVDSLEFLQGKSTNSKKFTVKADGSIEANNGIFHGTIYAEDGYFKGEMSAECITSGLLSASFIDVDGLLSTDAFTARFAQINNLIADKASVYSLNALSGRVGTLETNYVSTTYLNAELVDVYGSISAVDARFRSLNASNITAGTLSVDRLDINGILSNIASKNIQAVDATVRTMRCSGLQYYNGSSYETYYPRQVTIGGTSYWVLSR